VIGVIDYYQQPPRDYRINLGPGQICHASVPFVLDVKPHRLRLDYHDYEKPGNSNYILERTCFENFYPQDDSSLRHLGLESDEFLLAYGCKRRPVILLSDFLSREDSDASLYSGFSVVPCYTIHDPAGNYKQHVTFELVLQAQAYQLKNVFYLPESDEFGLQTSFARLDRLQFVRSEHLFPNPVVLTDKALDLLRQWAWNYFGLPTILDPALETFIEKAKKELERRISHI
jgi:hypothetical protein